MKRLLVICLMIFGLMVMSATPTLAKDGIKVFGITSISIYNATSEINKHLRKWLQKNPDVKIVKSETDTNVVYKNTAGAGRKVIFYITVTIQYTTNPKTQ